ncbi:MAG: FkbM family methyltransferase, partial [Terracidiphilus sp.]
RMTTGAATQTLAYYSVLRGWQAHWPFSRGRGLPRIVKPALKSFVPVWLQIEPKVRMLLAGNDLVSRVILETCVWEEASWLAVLPHLSSGATVVDVGAHMGYFSLKAAAVVGTSGRVIAIEAHPQMISTLRGNIQANGASVVTVEPVACSDAEGVIDLFTASDSNTGSSSLSQSNASQWGPLGVTHQVPARPLDSILKSIGVSRVDVLKIDVEGAELRVLTGAKDTLARHHPVILIELDDSLLQPMHTSAAEITTFLRDLGYTVHGPYDESNFVFCPNPAGSQARLM